MSTEENKALVRRWSEELFNQGKLEVADQIVAPTYRRHDPGDPFVMESYQASKSSAWWMARSSRVGQTGTIWARCDYAA